jgi:hypothetical protein
MPFNVNNIDLSVNANALFGLNIFLQTYDLEVVNDVFDEETEQIIRDVTDFLCWGIRSQIILKRPDLSLTYYPSVYDFYWFVARHYNFLKGEGTNLRFEALEYCRQ